MLVVVGTVPDPSVPILTGEALMDHGYISVSGRSFPVNRGTPALLGAAIQTCRALGAPAPVAYLVGDIGLGVGSRLLYRYLCDNMKAVACEAIVFHYLQPDVDWHNRVLFALEALSPRPVRIADAGFMYAAKMSGQAPAYDLFTPDIGELSFLADEVAPHPFYTRGFILHMQEQVEEMIARAYRFENAARCLLVKGRCDVVADREGVRARIDSPDVPQLEPIGGTGDTITGVAAALAASGMPVLKAALNAARINRVAGEAACPDPATQVGALIDRIPQAVRMVLKEG